MGILGGEAKNTDGYKVDTRKAIESLQKKSPEVVQWQGNNVNLEAIPQLVFSRDVCHFIS